MKHPNIFHHYVLMVILTVYFNFVQDYVVRLADEASLIDLGSLVLIYYKRIQDYKASATVSLMIVEHIYYKHDSHATAVQKAHKFNQKWGKYSDLHPASLGKAVRCDNPSVEKSHPASFNGPPTVDDIATFDGSERIEKYSRFIFIHGDERAKTRALLCSVYYHALHDRYYVARDLLLMSHIQDFIEKAEVKTQILYNRALVTLGLCAFRMSLFQKAHECLQNICSGRMKDFLAQGQMNRWGVDRDPEQEKLEKRRQMPYHMHINPDLLECCHLTCAMILELPNLARPENIILNQNIVSSKFRKHLHGYSRQVFTGPPENTREHVLAATKALLAGDWQRACTYILDLDVWNYIPNEGGRKVKEMLRVRIKEEAVRTYLLINSEHYESMDIRHICDMFEMEEPLVRKIISRMIFFKEISAAWDNPSNILVIYRTGPSSLQAISQTLGDKVSKLLESNERILDSLVGVYGYKDDWNSKDNRGDQYTRKNRLGGKGYSSHRPMPVANRHMDGRRNYHKYKGTGDKGKPKKVWNNQSSQ